ncbi:MAG TPA: DUF4333 domain-containing protein [Mycobacterium sp.]|nr:DUF4333 domain-containing protein [Mycobacterium sp.]
MHTAAAAFAALGAAAAVLCGCSATSEVGIAPTVSRDALQREITDRLASAGEAPHEVTCKEDLVGEVGMTARCEVVLSPANSFEPVITVTKADGSTIDYEMTPAVSKEQLEKAVSRLAAGPGVTIQQVTCETGLDGKVGAVAHCDVEAGDVTVRRTVKVDNVEGLMMNFDLVPL